MPESRERKKDDDYTPAVEKKDRKPVRIGSGRWVVPTMLGLFIVGLLWIVTFYIAGSDIPFMAALNPLVNVLIGFAFIIAGFVVSTKWK